MSDRILPRRTLLSRETLLYSCTGTVPVGGTVRYDPPGHYFACLVRELSINRRTHRIRTMVRLHRGLLLPVLLSSDPSTRLNGLGSSRRRCAPPIAREPALSEFAVFGSPRVVVDKPFPGPATEDANRSVLLYLPGIELSGYSLHRQVKALRSDFDVRWLAVPQDDRTSFEGLADLVDAAIEESADEGRSTFVVGESFGGVLALYVALRNAKPPPGLGGLALVNPATSIDRSWAARLPPLLDAVASLPEPLSEATYAALATPLLAGISSGDYAADPLQLGRRDSDSALPAPLRDLQAIARLGAALPELTALPSALPLPTLAYRLEMLQQAAAKVSELPLKRLALPVDILASTDDKLLPSTEEGRRLARELPGGKLVPMRQSGHVPLLEARVSLAELLRSSQLTTRGARPRKDFVADFAPPSAEAFANASESIRRVRQLTSPIFLSTAADGRRVAGLGGLPELASPTSLTSPPSPADGTADGGAVSAASDAKPPPVLFIGNHQLYGVFDLPLLVEEMYLQTGTLVRALAHPVAFRSGERAQTPPEGDGGATPRAGGGFVDFETFGAVPVSPRALFKLLSRGEPALLYPGGVREAFKSTKKGEAYQLFWPDDSSDFARVAAKFGATIVPVAAIGAEDGWEMLLDADELLALPILGDRVAEGAKNAPVGRKGERFVSPVSVPKPPGRFYFLFGAPISTAGVDPSDKEACAAVYQSVRAELESSLRYLLDRRRSDPYEPLLPRAAVEATWNFTKQVGSQGPAKDPTSQ